MERRSFFFFFFSSRRNKTFDAVIIEQLWYQCYYALVKHYNSPVLIGFLSVGNLPYVMDSVGKRNTSIIQKKKRKEKEKGKS